MVCSRVLTIRYEHGVLSLRRQVVQVGTTAPPELSGGGASDLAELACGTPVRGQALGRMVDGGVISAEQARKMIVGGRVTDEAWSVVAGLDPGPRHVDEEAGGGGPRSPGFASKIARAECWLAEFFTTSGSQPVDYDPVLHTGAAFPHHTVVRLLDELSRQGWKLIHISEDRRVDDQAQVSSVSAARYLLSREADGTRSGSPAA